MDTAFDADFHHPDSLDCLAPMPAEIGKEWLGQRKAQCRADAKAIGQYHLRCQSPPDGWQFVKGHFHCHFCAGSSLHCHVHCLHDFPTVQRLMNVVPAAGVVVAVTKRHGQQRPVPEGNRPRQTYTIHWAAARCWQLLVVATLAVALRLDVLRVEAMRATVGQTLGHGLRENGVVLRFVPALGFYS